MTVAIYKQGDWWYLNYRDHTGKQIKRKASQSHEKAKLMLQKLLGERVEKKLLGETISYEKVTVRAAVAQYLETVRARGEENTWVCDSQCIKNIIPYIDGYLQDVSQAAVDRYIVQRTKAVKASTINRELAVLSAMLNQCVKWKLIPVNPLGKLKRLRIAPGRIRYLLPEERALLFPALSRHIHPIAVVALYTGMRKGEILALCWQDIDFGNDIIHVENSKTHTRRDIPMAAEVKELLQGIPRNSERIFPGIGHFRWAWHNSCARAGIRNFRFHDLRHTFASYLVMQGEHLLTVKELLGHKSIEMTMRYAHLSPDMKKTAIQRLSQTLRISPDSRAIPEPMGRKWEAQFFQS